MFALFTYEISLYGQIELGSFLHSLFFLSFFSHFRDFIEQNKQHRVTIYLKVKVAHLTLCNPMDCTLQGSSAHGILQARKLGWVAVLFSNGSSQPMD